MRRKGFTAEHIQFRDSVRDFISHEIAPHFADWERAGQVSWDLYAKAGDMGLMGMKVPGEYGGGGITDIRFETILQEELAGSGMLGAGQGLVTHQLVVDYLLRLADDEQKKRWLGSIAAGEILCGIAMTEPGTGSDLSAISTRAVRRGDTYVINGAKTFISSGVLGRLYVLVTRTGDQNNAHERLSLIVVEDGTPGFSRGRNLDKIGQHSADTAELSFVDAHVPASNLLGEEGCGFHYLVQNLPAERLMIAAAATAHARIAFDETLNYVKSRVAFGRAVGTFQHNRFTLATMKTELDLAQAFVDRQIEAYEDGELTAEDAAEAKWWCTDLNRRVLDGCLQLHGGYGYMEEYPIARLWRDGRAMSIYGGTNEIMKDLIGRRMLGL